MVALHWLVQVSVRKMSESLQPAETVPMPPVHEAHRRLVWALYGSSSSSASSLVANAAQKALEPRLAAAVQAATALA